MRLRAAASSSSRRLTSSARRIATERAGRRGGSTGSLAGRARFRSAAGRTDPMGDLTRRLLLAPPFGIRPAFRESPRAERISGHRRGSISACRGRCGDRKIRAAKSRLRFGLGIAPKPAWWTLQRRSATGPPQSRPVPAIERMAALKIHPSIGDECVQILVRDNNVDQALKVLKKKMQREGIFREMKLRGHYEKPSERRAREKAEAVRRARKLARKRAQREGLLPMTPKPVTAAARAPRRG